MTSTCPKVCSCVRPGADIPVCYCHPYTKQSLMACFLLCHYHCGTILEFRGHPHNFHCGLLSSQVTTQKHCSLPALSKGQPHHKGNSASSPLSDSPSQLLNVASDLGLHPFFWHCSCWTLVSPRGVQFNWVWILVSRWSGDRHFDASGLCPSERSDCCFSCIWDTISMGSVLSPLRTKQKWCIMGDNSSWYTCPYHRAASPPHCQPAELWRSTSWSCFHGFGFSSIPSVCTGVYWGPQKPHPTPPTKNKKK
jgi:hypothetical protein